MQCLLAHISVSHISVTFQPLFSSEVNMLLSTISFMYLNSMDMDSETKCYEHCKTVRYTVISCL